ncbi:unnamed protein product [Orchesella dallaii]|uniref:Uncharacterized protein n=1 Tax=Orchesella dallaii TaxID=48710 RepID=A0ABP1Q1J2_9HEXA
MAAGGFAFVAILHMFSGVAISFMVFGASMSTMGFAEIAIRNGRCNSVLKEAMDFLCDSMRSLPPKFRDYNCDQLPSVNCYIAYMSWVYERRSTVLKVNESTTNSSSGPDCSTEVSMIEFPGIVEELIFMVIQAPIYIIVLMLLEYRVFHRLCAMVWRKNEDEIISFY